MWMHFAHAIMAQAAAPAELQPLLQSGNPTIVALGSILAILFGADKVAFWINKIKARGESVENETLAKVAECLKLVAQSLEEGRREGREAHARIETALADLLRASRQ